MFSLLTEFTPHQHLMAVLIGVPRLFMFVQTAPYMGNAVFTGQIRFSVVLTLYFVLHPLILSSLPSFNSFDVSTMLWMLAIITKEVFLGMFLGLVSGMVFWAIHSAGFFIDNQRGAGQAQGTDPLSGEEASPTASFFFQSAVYIFYATGMFISFMGIIYATYEAWPVVEAIPKNLWLSPNLPIFFAEKVNNLSIMFVLLSGPVVVACLLTDISLGLINRFASQLNVYVLAMPIKSALASFLLIIYFSLLMSNAQNLFDDFAGDFRTLKVFWQ